MGKITELLPSGGRFMTKDDVPDPRKFTIRAFDWVELDDDELKPMVIFKELDKPMVLNRTNLELLAQCVGDDTDAAIGKVITVWHDPTVMMSGKRVGGLRIKPHYVEPFRSWPRKDAPVNAEPAPWPDAEPAKEWIDDTTLARLQQGLVLSGRTEDQLCERLGVQSLSGIKASQGREAIRIVAEWWNQTHNREPEIEP